MRPPTMAPRSSQFLDAFTGIERHLRRILNAENHLPFHQFAVSRYRSHLRSFGNQRNFIVHEYRYHDSVVVPSPATVDPTQEGAQRGPLAGEAGQRVPA